jgi:transcriptional regulator with XRE-family HTH domain
MGKSISAPHSAHAGSPEQVFGRVLKSMRESQSLSQEALGFRSGYHRTYIGQLERGEKSASLRTIVNLAATLNIRPSLLIRRMERDLSKAVPKPL